MRRHTIQIALAGSAASILIVAAMLQLHGVTVEGWQLATRYTARLSFFIFLAVYLLSPLAAIWRPSFVAATLRERRGLGVAFAGAHFVHLAALIMFFRTSQIPAPLVTVAGGGLAYLVIAAMAATSNDASVHALGARRWRWLHRIGLHYVWLIFVFTLLGGIRKRAPDLGTHEAMLVLALLALALRSGVYFMRRTRLRLAENTR